MIQRIQTVYLFLIFGLMATMPFLPVLDIGSFSWSLSVECGLAAILSLIAIFLYKKRKVQMNACYVILGLLVLSYLIVFFDLWLPNRALATVVAFKMPIIFPLFAIILDILAIHSIRKDEKLVRSLDRLR